MVVTQRLELTTRHENDVLDITHLVQGVADGAAIVHGTATVFVIGSTAALTTIEFEPGLMHDLPNALERIAPRDALYQHEERWHDDNGHSHIRAALIGPSITIPIVDRKLTLGTWQQIVLIELDTRPRSRTVVVQLLGE